ncbi:MAG: helix-turn-helix domain-containing protein [Flavobacteriaceae bacterium]|nr:helix-turn-helix domain-containing protein [Flavobacteriaceae bacterium]
MSHETIIKTEIQGIEAKDLLNRFDTLESRLTELHQTVKPENKIVLLTRKEVAKMLGISLPTLHAWSKGNILIPYRIGNKVRYKEHEVLEALQNINAQNNK